MSINARLKPITFKEWNATSRGNRKYFAQYGIDKTPTPIAHRLLGGVRLHAPDAHAFGASFLPTRSVVYAPGMSFQNVFQRKGCSASFATEWPQPQMYSVVMRPKIPFRCETLTTSFMGTNERINFHIFMHRLYVILQS